MRYSKILFIVSIDVDVIKSHSLLNTTRLSFIPVINLRETIDVYWFIIFARTIAQQIG